MHLAGADLVREAIAAWREAGRRASERSANVEAERHYTEALALVHAIAEAADAAAVELPLQIARGAQMIAIKGNGAPEVEEAYRRAEALCERVGDVRVSSMDDVAEVCRERNIIVGVIAVPAESAQDAADALIGAGVKIVFNYSEALLDTPADVQVHTSNPAVELLYALYFHLT